MQKRINFELVRPMSVISMEIMNVNNKKTNSPHLYVSMINPDFQTQKPPRMTVNMITPFLSSNQHCSSIASPPGWLVPPTLIFFNMPFSIHTTQLHQWAYFNRTKTVNTCTKNINYFFHVLFTWSVSWAYC